MKECILTFFTKSALLSRPSSDDLMIEKCLSGFNCVASVAGYYRMSDVMDNLVVSLAKFSTLQNVTDLPIAFVPIFGKRQFCPHFKVQTIIKRWLFLSKVPTSRLKLQQEQSSKYVTSTPIYFEIVGRTFLKLCYNFSNASFSIKT